MFFQFQFLCNLRYMLSKALVVAVGARIVFEIMFLRCFSHHKSYRKNNLHHMTWYTDMYGITTMSLLYIC
jgi:hypothetical protein